MVNGLNLVFSLFSQKKKKTTGMRQIPRVAAVTLDKSQLDVPFTKVNQTGQ